MMTSMIKMMIIMMMMVMIKMMLMRMMRIIVCREGLGAIDLQPPEHYGYNSLSDQMTCEKEQHRRRSTGWLAGWHATR